MRGQIGRVVDGVNSSGPLSNRADYSYDVLGRLTGLPFTGVGSGLETSYAYDDLGRITQKGGRTIHYHDATRPHWVTEVHQGTQSTPIAHDPNGNRTRARGGNPDYTYDAWDRLKSVAISTGSVEFVYDYSGRRVAKLVHSFLGTGVTFYYSELAELSGNELFKSYYLGGLRVASQRKSCTGCELAALTPTEAVRLAAVSLKGPAVVVLLRRDVQLALALALVLFGTGVLLAPWKRRRVVVGIALRPGQVIVVAVLFLSGTFPWPIVLGPAEAQCGNAPTPTPQPTPTATPVSVGEVRHYHTDHLGSTQVVTDAAGTMVEQIGYQPYGEVRGRWSASGQWLNAPMAQDTREFTGYDSEILSGLMYAGARWYDPTLGLFLTHDPARQFASPYTYTNGDPVNLTDPMGAFVGELIAGILAIAKFIADYAVPIGVTVGFGNAFGQTLANGGSFEQAFAAGVIGGVMGGVGAYGMGIVGAYVASFGNPLLSYALAAVALASGTYQTVESFRSGQYVAGAVGAVFVAFGVASMLASTSRAAQGGNGQTGGLSQQEQLDFAVAEYGQRFSSEATPIQYADARGVVLNDVSGPTVYEGEASYYNLPGNRTASGDLFDPNANTAAMTADKAPLGTRVTVEYSSQTPNGPVTNRIVVTVNDRGPFAVGPNGRALMPLQPHPTRIIDLTPHAFTTLVGTLRPGHVPVKVIVP